MRNLHQYTYISLCLIFLGISLSTTAQTTQKTSVEDSDVSLGQLQLPDPSSIERLYRYDELLDRYVYDQKIGDYQIDYPVILTPDQYQDLMDKENRYLYFKEKVDSFSGKKEGTEEKRKNLLPIFYVDSNFFETIFGGNEIEIIPQGAVEMDLGALYTKQENPSLSPRNQSNFTLDFDQRISVSLLGKIGKRLQINTNYDTESTFNFQNQIKLGYTPTEDDIIQSIEVGNVSMPLSSSLIRGAQSLFGFKLGLKFGNTTVTGVFSEQRSESKSVSIESGGTKEEFQISSWDYDQDKHFFLSHFFRDTYDQAVKNYPFIQSPVQVTRVEVWVTNRSSNATTITDARNIVAFQDLGEDNRLGNVNTTETTAGSFFNTATNSSFGVPYSDNKNNQLNPELIDQSGLGPINDKIRQISTVSLSFQGADVQNYSEGVDYAVLENARQLNPSEYTLNAQLGYISLNQRLSNDEILAVAFQYTAGGQVYQVGEFANDSVDATIDQTDADNNTNLDLNEGTSRSLMVKLLKSRLTNINQPIWDLMMKNIYSTGAYRINSSDFRMNIVYANPSPLNYIETQDGALLPNSSDPTIDIEENTLLKVFGMDQLNMNNDPVLGGDGFFDFVSGVTVDANNGRIIFPSIEPFGRYLFDKLDKQGDALTNTGADYDDNATWNANQSRYVFKELYDSSKILAEQQGASKNYFQLRGQYISTGQNGISIGAFNVPRGSVQVTAGGRILQEGVDYSVNYQLGRVYILDESLSASNTPIEVSTENNAVFGQQTKRFSGVNVEHRFSDELQVGATFLNLKERPLTQKSSFNYEPVNNTIAGFNLNFAKEIPFLTRMTNHLPNIDTDAASSMSVRTEVAHLMPGAPNASDFEGKVTSYIDDFEGAQTSIDIRNPLAWELCSVPLDFGNTGSSDPTAINPQNVTNGIDSGYKRSKFSWYTIDPLFYSAARPDGVSLDDISNNASRRVTINELYAQTDLVVGQNTTLFSLDLLYEPNLRGPYNYDPQLAPVAGQEIEIPANRARDQFGGIMRSLSTTNFEQSNIEFLEFWLLSPFSEDDNNPGGKLVIDLGQISEDVLADGRKQYENGLPVTPDQIDPNNPINGLSLYNAKVAGEQSLIYAFDTQDQQRVNQDVGYDGLSDEQERLVFPDFASLDDPAGDNYQYFASDLSSGSIQDRYRKYNGQEGNSPTDISDTQRGSTATPTVEDVNRDNTMNTINAYHTYEIDITPNLNENSRYVSDVIVGQAEVPNDGAPINYRWIRFKIPIYSPDASHNIDANDFRSISFMRMYMTGFQQETLLRIGTLDLVRGDYRRYIQSGLEVNTEGINTQGNIDMGITSVSTEETQNYISPPGVIREQLMNNNTIVREDEKSLSLSVEDLPNQDARAVYKNFNIDMRQYENLELFLHAEPLDPTQTLDDGALTAFVRMGSDFTDNFYEIEVPLEVSDSNLGSSVTEEDVWPLSNRLTLDLSVLQTIKSRVLGDANLVSTDLNYFDSTVQNISLAPSGNRRYGIKGNPSYGDIRVMMLGIKNNSGVTQSGTVWFNEMRLTELKNRGGWAALASADMNLADFASVSASGSWSGIGFGSIEQGPAQRNTDDTKQYDLTASANVGKLLPENWRLNVPFTYTRGVSLVTPQFDPQNQDLELQTVLDAQIDAQRRQQIKEQSEDFTLRESYSVIGLRKNRNPQTKKLPMPYDVENFTVSGTYNTMDHRDFQIQEARDQSVNVNLNYTYPLPKLALDPFKKAKFLKGGYLKLLRDFNINLLPSSFTASSNINRTFNSQIFRDVTLVQGSITAPPLIQRNFTNGWQYGFNHKLTKSLDYNFNASASRIVRNYIDPLDNSVDNSIGIFDDFLNEGDANTHNHQFKLNYKLPLDKIPLFRFVQSNYSYNGDFQWTKGSESLRNVSYTDPNTGLVSSYDLGNTIQNSSGHTLSANLNMTDFYRYVGLEKRKRSGYSKKKKNKKKNTKISKKAKEKAKQKAKKKRLKRRSKLSTGDKIYNSTVGLLTMLKKVNVSYRQNNGSFLPGYLRTPGFLGTVKPSWSYIFGLDQRDARYTAASSGWISQYPEFNQQYTSTKTNNFNIQASIQPFKDFTVDISATRDKSSNFSESFRIQNGAYQSLTPFDQGNYSITALPIRTAFTASNAASSRAFEDFKSNRLLVAQRLASNDSRSSGLDDDGYPTGYGKTNQSVLIPAFLAAYTGTDANSISTSPFRNMPLPNWNLKYTGLMKNKWFKKRFRRFSLQHGYQSMFTLNQFTTNLNYQSDATLPLVDQQDAQGNFQNPTLFSSVNLTEQFSPLVKIDLETRSAMKVLAEWRKDRALSLSLDNNILTEVQGNEFILGLGYRWANLPLRMRIAGKKQIIKSDLNFRADLSYRKNETLARYLDLNNTQITAGQTIYSLKFTADYAFSKNLTAILFYDHSYSEYSISTTFPQTTIRGGFTIRYNLGGR